MNKTVQIELNDGDVLTVARANGEVEEIKKESFNDLPKWVSDDSFRFTIQANGDIEEFCSPLIKEKRFFMGLLLKTEREAEIKRDHMLLTAEIERFIDYHNSEQGWVADWEDMGQIKLYVRWCHYSQIPDSDFWTRKQQQKIAMSQDTYNKLKSHYTQDQLKFYITGVK